jgi:hypothetical protein
MLETEETPCKGNTDRHQTTHRHTAIPTTSITGAKKKEKRKGRRPEKQRDQKKRETETKKRRNKRRGNEQNQNRGEGARATSDFASSPPAQVSFFCAPPPHSCNFNYPSSVHARLNACLQT